MPGLAAAASWMNDLKMPLREIHARYTKSELAILAWRAGEVSHTIASRTSQSRGGTFTPQQTSSQREFALPESDMADLERRLGPVAYKLENEKGQVDLRQLTGEEAMIYMRSLGIQMGRSF